eukprot:scaffold604981_cov41-Prasinocladus_malaysianus.AAC.1
MTTEPCGVTFCFPSCQEGVVDIREEYDEDVHGPPGMAAQPASRASAPTSVYADRGPQSIRPAGHEDQRLL